MVYRIAASFSGAALLFGVLLGGGRAFAQGAETGPADATTTAAAAEAATNQRIDALQQMLEQIQKELIALKQARAAAVQPAVTAQPQTPPQTQALLSSSSASDAENTAVAESTTVAASQRSTPPAEVKSNPNDPHSEPFAWGDFTWLTGNARTKDTPYATEFFTPEIRVDANYTYDFRHPQDDTISGSSEIFRSNEVQLTQLGVGGDFHYQNVRARLMTQFGMYSQTTPRNDASPARGQWNLDNAYRYVSEAYGGYHFNVQHGINVDAGIFMSYVGLFSGSPRPS
jgi:hypothetical protein